METIYKEHWKHARHCELQRLWFTNIYAIVVAAILAFIGQTGSGQQIGLGPPLLLALFGLILSSLGFCMVISLSLAFDHHKTDTTMILYYWDQMEFHRHPQRPVFFVNVLRQFYETTTALFAVLLLYYASQKTTFLQGFCNNPLGLILVFGTIIAIIEVLYRLKWEKYFKESWRFERVLRNDTEGRYRKDWDTWFKDLNFRKNIVKDAKRKRKKK